MYPHLRPPSESTKPKDGHSEHSVSSFFSSQPPTIPCFILDSGSTAHMTSKIDFFVSLDPSEEGIGIGTINLMNEHGSIILTKVLYVPELAVNLLSVRCLVLDEFLVNFEMNSFSVSKSNNIVMSGKYVSKLPTVEFKSVHHTSLYSPSELLHKLLGHVSYHRIRQRLGIPVNDFSSCKACAVSKITWGSFHTCHSQATKPFEELHMDLVGPISPLSREGHKYFLTIVDSCTRFCSAIPIKHKRSGIIQQSFTLTEGPTILQDTGLNKRLWSEIVRTSTLTLNQIPCHKSKFLRGSTLS
ncbi:hypothetical protein VP01_410g5 [Puccinia sorghi]|uniref:Retrovirus-related Pol polyprotein from transposon TNT 1-94-like beta-barrel domain-containing protein n=1 Tax=Puccinia sorghi TaxID=27349 RepID=A0A0L6UR98_9BASI|nr:hypothetical protein VP01_410g5 [Puccinia sorghi]